MAAQPTDLPTVQGFNFHALTLLPLRDTLVYLPAADNAGLPASLQAGDFNETPSGQPSVTQSTVLVTIDSGRYGMPHLRLHFRRPLQAGPDFSLCFEPGVEVRTRSGAFRQLESLEFDKLGRPGGGGHMYDKDAPEIARMDKNIRRRVVRIIVTTRQCTVLDTMDSLRNWRQLVNPQSAEQQIVNAYQSREVVTARLYVLLRSEAHAVGFFQSCLEPLQACIKHRVMPLHQYTSPNPRLFGLNLPFRYQLRDGIYQQTRGGPDSHHMLMDTQTRTTRQPVARVHMVGHIREFQASSSFCNSLSQVSQAHGTHRIQIRQSAFNHLSSATSQVANVGGIQTPNSQYTYLGYVELSGTPQMGQMTAPPPGKHFEMLIRQGNNSVRVLGMVLSLPSGIFGRFSYQFVVHLLGLPDVIRQQVARQVVEYDLALTYIGDEWPANAQLASMRLFERTTTDHMRVMLQQAAIFPATRHGPQGEDIRGNVPVWDRAISDILALPGFQASPLSPAERGFLQTGVQRVDWKIQLLQVSTSTRSFMSVLALVLAAVATGRRVVIVAESLRDRVQCANRLSEWLAVLASKPNMSCQNTWRLATLACYTTVNSDEGDKRDGDARALRLTVAMKYMTDDLPHHDWLTGDAGSPRQTRSRTNQLERVPVNLGIGGAIQRLVQGAITSQQPLGELQTYFRHRREVLDDDILGRLTPNQLRERLQTRQNTVERALDTSDILVTDCATAMTTEVTRAFPQSFIVMTGTHDIHFVKAMSALMCYPNMNALMVCGAPPVGSDGMVGRLASYAPENEALLSFPRSFWEVLRLTGRRQAVAL